MPTLAKKITVDLKDQKFYIDGVEFPWFISEEGVDVSGLGTTLEIPRATFTVLADTVEVIPSDAGADA